jgi:hypothetical protein
MKKFIQRVQDLSQKAAHLKQVVEAAPAQAAQLRDTVLMTAGQLQQMRHDVQSSVMGLKADNEGRLAQALQDINDHAGTFSNAGYELTGVDMELSPTQRLIVHLEKTDVVEESTLRSLLAENSANQTIYALLSALAKADAVSDRVRLSHLHYCGVVVHVGPMPSIRLCWAPEQVAEAAIPDTAAQATQSSAPFPAPPPLPEFSQSSFFEKRPAAAAAPRPVSEQAPAIATTPAAEPASAAVSVPASLAQTPRGGDWKASALDRFKKMPDVSKYRR